MVNYDGNGLMDKNNDVNNGLMDENNYVNNGLFKWIILYTDYTNMMKN